MGFMDIDFGFKWGMDVKYGFEGSERSNALEARFVWSEDVSLLDLKLSVSMV